MVFQLILFTQVEGVTKGVGGTVSGITGGLGEGVGKLGKGDVIGTGTSVVGGVGKGLGNLGSGIWEGVSGKNRQPKEDAVEEDAQEGT